MSFHSREYTALANCTCDLGVRLDLEPQLVSDLNEASLIGQELYEDILLPRSMLTVRGNDGSDQGCSETIS